MAVRVYEFGRLRVEYGDILSVRVSRFAVAGLVSFLAFISILTWRKNSR
jgi:hypothetical protein